MRISIGLVCRLAIALVFAVALSLGIGQVVAASGGQGPCDTEPGTCEENDDCFDACFKAGGWEKGGDCFNPPGCCLCIM